MRAKACKIQALARQIATRERVRQLFIYDRFMETLPYLILTQRSVFNRDLNMRVNERRHMMIQSSMKGMCVCVCVCARARASPCWRQLTCPVHSLDDAVLQSNE